MSNRSCQPGADDMYIHIHILWRASTGGDLVSNGRGGAGADGVGGMGRRHRRRPHRRLRHHRRRHRSRTAAPARLFLLVAHHFFPYRLPLPLYLPLSLKIILVPSSCTSTFIFPS